MSSKFEDDFMDGDAIETTHVSQYSHSIRDLESGKAFYREASGGTGKPYIVDFTKDSDPAVRKNHITTSALNATYDPDNDLQPGQIVMFKADVNSPADATLQLLLEDGSSGTSSAEFPLHVGNDQVGLDVVKADQIVIAVYNNTSTPRFDVMGVAPALVDSVFGRIGDVVALAGDYDATQVSDDSGVTSPAGTVADALSQLDGDTTTNASDISTNAGDIATNTSNISANTTAISGKQDTLTGTSDVPGLDSALLGKQGSNGSLDEISTLDSSMAKGDMYVHDGTSLQRLSPGTDGQVLQSDSATSNGLSWANATSGAVDSVFGRSGNVSAAVGDYDASEISDDSGVTSPAGSVSDALSQLDSGKEDAANKDQANGYAGLNSSALVPLERGGTGADLSATGGPGQVLKQGSSGGAISVGSLSASEIGSGSVDDTEFGHLDGVSSGIQAQLDGKAALVHTHVADDITDFDQAVADALSAAEWAHFPLLESDIVSADLSDTDIDLGIRNAGDQLGRNLNNRMVLSEGLYVISWAAACEINTGGPLEVGLFEYSGAPIEVAGSVRASYGDQNVHGTVVGDAVISVPASQTREIGLRTGSTVVDGKIIANSGFFRVAKVNGGVAANGQTNALNDLSDVLTNTPQSGDLFGYNGSVFTNQTPAALGLGIGTDVQAHGDLLDDLQGLSGSLSEGAIVSDGSGIVLQKTNLAATAAPSASDNFSAGWTIGSTWLHSGTYYLCTGDGVWVQVFPTSSSSGSVGDYMTLSPNSVISSSSSTTILDWSSTQRTSSSGTTVFSPSNSRLQTTESGLFMVGVTYGYQQDYSGQTFHKVQVNGSTSDEITQTVVETTGTTQKVPVSMSTICTLAANDYVEVKIYTGSGTGNRGVFFDDYGKFWMRRIG